MGDPSRWCPIWMERSGPSRLQKWQVSWKNEIGKEINEPTFVAWVMGISLEGRKQRNLSPNLNRYHHLATLHQNLAMESGKRGP